MTIFIDRPLTVVCDAVCVQESHPLRWMPPESHQSEPPIYNFKTDVWSYGITLWEMYSQGTQLQQQSITSL